MRVPFDTDVQDLAHSFSRRLALSLDDRWVAESSSIVLVLDAYFLYCLLLEDLEDDISGMCAREIYACENFKFAVVPETLWEIKNVLEESLENLVLSGDIVSLRKFIARPEAKVFINMMSREPEPPWDDVVSLVIDMISKAETRNWVKALFRYETVRRFERPLELLAQDISSGKMLRMNELCGLFGLEDLGFEEEDLEVAYSTLMAYRGRHKNDLIDAMVYARCSFLNNRAVREELGYRCRFLSHESMIEMLEHVDSRQDEPLVRSLTDLSTTAAIVKDRVPVDQVEELRSLSDSIKGVEEGAEIHREVIRVERLRSRLRDLRDQVVFASPGWANIPMANFSELARKRMQKFFDTMQGLRSEEETEEEIRQRHKRQILNLYNALNNLRGRQGGLDDFMAPVLRRSFRVWDVAEVEEEDLLDFFMQYLNSLRDIAEVSDLITEMLRSKISFPRSIALVRAKLEGASVEELQVFVYFLQKAESIVKRQRESLKKSVSELSKQVEELIEEAVETVAELSPLVHDLLVSMSRLGQVDVFDVALEKLEWAISVCEQAGEVEKAKQFSEAYCSAAELKISC